MSSPDSRVNDFSSRTRSHEWWVGPDLELWVADYAGENYEIHAIQCVRRYVQIHVVIGTVAVVLNSQHYGNAKGRKAAKIANEIRDNPAKLDELRGDSLVLDFRRGGLGRAGGVMEFV